MEKYTVSGMSCAACSARVEKAVSSVEGVTMCSVNLLTNTMEVDGTATDAEITAAVEKAGYKAFKQDSGKSEVKDETDSEYLKMKTRLIWSVVLLIPLMYVSMGHMFGMESPFLSNGNYIAFGLLQLLIAAAIMVVNQKFFVSGFKGLVNRAPNMDTLVSLGAGAAFVYSTYALFAMSNAQAVGDGVGAMGYMYEFYFESAGMILTLISVGKMLEARSKGKTADALKSLMELAPKTATLIKDGREVTVGIENVRVGDIFVVRPGESVPVDGEIIEGMTAVDESSLTGESIPVDKSEHDEVYAATVNQSGFVKCRAVKVGEDTTLSQIIKMVNDASSSKAPIAKVADRVSGVFVPVVISIAAVTIIAWLVAGYGIGFALARGISVLVISCPCALGLATPVAIMVGSGVGAKNGILFKNATSLEETGKVKTVVLDKTGTVTKGKPVVTDIIPFEITETELLKYACTLESKSEHPLAGAVMEKSNEMNINPLDSENFKAIAGNGLTAEIDGTEYFGGNIKFISEKISLEKSVSDRCGELADDGKTPMLFCSADKLLGIIAVSDVIKEDSAEAVDELHNMGINVVMLTGDNSRTANAIGKKTGVDKVIADVLPDGKEKIVSELGKDGRVAMVGDGINDAPALTRADIGMAIGAGADVAVDAADVVLMNSSLKDAVAAIRLSRASLKNIYENLFWAFIYNVIGIPVAAGVFGLSLNPMLAAAAMSLSSVCVVTNALRLNNADIKNNKNPKRRTNKMKKTLKIEGMMCGHCEGRVRESLEALEAVEKADVSHKKGKAVVSLKTDVSDDVLRNTVEAQGYKVTGIE